MANLEHLEILKQGVEVWNQWRKENPDIEPNLAKANLSSANLTHVDLNSADLRNTSLNLAHLLFSKFDYANLSSADLSFANLSGANLRSVDLSFAKFSFANLYFASLRDANLSNAEIIATVLDGADLQNSDWENASLQDTIFSNVDLSGVKNLDKVIHAGPSRVSYETLFNPKNQSVPESFWRGCGVPKDLLDYLPSLITNPLNFQSCFISYTEQDKDFVFKLFDRMQKAGLNVWFSPHSMKWGAKLHEEIYNAIHLQDRLLVILSEHSINSAWVKTEICKACEEEQKRGVRKLFPIRLVDFETLKNWQCFDADSGKDLAKEIRQYLVPDVSDWQDETAFEANFQRLLKSLNPNSGLPIRTRQKT